MATSKFVVSTKASAVDRIGDIDSEIAELRAEREKLVKKLGKKPLAIESSAYKAVLYWRTPTSLDLSKLKKFLGEKKYLTFRKKGEPVLALRITEL